MCIIRDLCALRTPHVAQLGFCCTSMVLPCLVVFGVVCVCVCVLKTLRFVCRLVAWAKRKSLGWRVGGGLWLVCVLFGCGRHVVWLVAAARAHAHTRRVMTQ